MKQNRYDLLNELQAVPTPPSLRGWKGVIGNNPPPYIQEDDWPPEVPENLPRIPFGVNRWPPLPRHQNIHRGGRQEHGEDQPAAAGEDQRQPGPRYSPPAAGRRTQTGGENPRVQHAAGTAAYLDDDIIEVCRRCNKAIPDCTCWGLKKE